MSTGSINLPAGYRFPTPPADMSETSKMLDRVKKQVREFYFEEVSRALQGGAPFAAFSHMLMTLNYLIKLASGNADVQRDQFIAFCNAYLPHYDADAFYATFRCGYAHAGIPQASPGETAFLLTHGQPDQHLTHHTQYDYVIMLNAESFLSDLENAFSKMCRNAMVDSRAGKKLATNMQNAYAIGPAIHED